jgi:hypothetical protein
MNNRNTPRRPLRRGTPSKSGHSGKSNKYGWYRPHWCPPYYDYNWYDYDYDWYDYDDNYLYTPPRSRAADMDSDQSAYRQGFKDGWAAAMEVVYYSSMEPMMPDHMPRPDEPMPQPPVTEPTTP